MWPFRKNKTWKVYYWYFDTLGCCYQIAEAEFKGRKTSDYIQGQGLSTAKRRNVERISRQYDVKFGFLLEKNL